MEIKVLSLQKQEKGSITLPSQFQEPLRQDVIKKAVEVLQANQRQTYGASPRAGMRSSADVSRRRRKYRGSYGHGISRVPRKVLTRRGTQFFWVGAVAPGTVGGRRAHPPKATKDWSLALNKKENKKAIRSALGAVMDKRAVTGRGHLAPEGYPFAIEAALEGVDKTKQAKQILSGLGFDDDLKRCAKRSIRAGKAKLRGRKTKKKTGLLIVVSEKCRFMKAAQNITGLTVADASSLNAVLLAPGAVPGRIALFTDKAIEKIGKEKLFA